MAREITIWWRPVDFCDRIGSNIRDSTSRLVRNFVSVNVTPLSEAMTKLIDEIWQSDSSRRLSSRRLTYKYVNSEMEVDKVYTKKQVINEVHRLCFTQFRTSGHSLACETGRWNRRGRGRLPLEERLCSCGQIQTEQHVTQHCPMTQGIRDLYHFNTVNDLFSTQFSNETLCRIVYEVLNTFK